MSDLQSTTTKKRQNLDSTFKLSPFQSLGFGVQKVEESAPATKAELWDSYQQAKQLNQKGTSSSPTPIQAKLTIGEPGDKYEQEADSMAAQVMRMPAQGFVNSNVTDSVQAQPIQRACTECQEEKKEESKSEEDRDQIQAKEQYGQTTAITSTSAKVTEIPNDSTIQRDSPGNLPPIPNYQLTMPSLGQPQDPSSRYNLGGDLSLHLDPQFQSTMQQVQEQVTPTTIRTALGQIKLNVPTSGTPAPAANPLAMPSQPTPTASPSVPAGDGPDKTRAADAGDLMDAILAIPSIETAIDSLKTQASDRITQDWQRLNTGEKVLGVSSLVVVGGGLLAGIIANPAARKLALDQLNGKVLPVPKLNWLHLEINTGGENLMLGLHVDVGQLLPASWGFKASSPNAIGGPPEGEPFSLQRKSDSVEDTSSSSSLEDRLNGSKGGGNPLSDEVRSFMEPRFGADFSGVRVHTGSDAVQMNQDVNAQAFAHGSDVYFGAGKAPGKDALTAHELTHVVQQTGRIQTKPAVSSSSEQIQRDGSVAPIFNAVKIPIAYAHDFNVKKGEYVTLNKVGLKFEGNVQEEAPKGTVTTNTFTVGGGGAGKTTPGVGDEAGKTSTSPSIGGSVEIKSHADNILAKNLENIAKELGSDVEKQQVQAIKKWSADVKSTRENGGTTTQGKIKYEGGVDIKLFDPGKLSFGLEFVLLGAKYSTAPKVGSAPLEFQVLSVSPKASYSTKKSKAFSLNGSDFGLEGKGEVNVEFEPDWGTIGKTILLELGVEGSLVLLGSAGLIAAPIVGMLATGEIVDLNMGLKIAALQGTKDVRNASLVVYKSVLMGYDASHETPACQKAFEEAINERRLAMGNMSLEMYQEEVMKDKSHIDVLSQQFFNRAMSSFIFEMHCKADEKMEEGFWTRFFSDKPTLHAMVDREIGYALTGIG